MVLFGVVCLALAVLVHLLFDKVDDEPRCDCKGERRQACGGKFEAFVVADGEAPRGAETDHSRSDRFLEGAVSGDKMCRGPFMITSAMIPTTHSHLDELDRLITLERFRQLLALAQSGHSLAALRYAILETAIATRTGRPVNSPDYV